MAAQSAVVVVTGELAIPFLTASKPLAFSSYDNLTPFGLAAASILSRAKARGITVLLPLDGIMSDDCLLAVTKAIAEKTVDPDARDEGGEFETDLRTMDFSVPEPAEPAAEAEGSGAQPTHAAAVKQISGYVHDIGPLTRAAAVAAIQEAHLVLLWGTAGCCEMSSLQQGTRDIVSAAAKTLPAEGAAPGAPKPHTVVLGGSAVEWAARLCDPTGELQGRLAQYGLVALALRRAATLLGVLGGIEPAVLGTVARRTSVPVEWAAVLEPVPKKEEIEEEEEEEEDEEDEEA